MRKNQGLKSSLFVYCIFLMLIKTSYRHVSFKISGRVYTCIFQKSSIFYTLILLMYYRKYYGCLLLLRQCHVMGLVKIRGQSKVKNLKFSKLPETIPIRVFRCADREFDVIFALRCLNEL